MQNNKNKITLKQLSNKTKGFMLSTAKEQPIKEVNFNSPLVAGKDSSPVIDKSNVRKTLPHKTVCAMVTDITETGLSLDEKVKNLFYEIGLAKGLDLENPGSITMTDIIESVAELRILMDGNDELKSILLSSYNLPEFNHNMLVLCRSAFGYEDSIFRK